MTNQATNESMTGVAAFLHQPMMLIIGFGEGLVWAGWDGHVIRHWQNLNLLLMRSASVWLG